MADDPLSQDARNPLGPAARVIYDGNRAEPRPQPAPGDLYDSLAVAAIEQRAPELWAGLGMDTAARHQLRDSFRSIARETRLPDGVLVKLANEHVDGLLVDARVKHDPEAATADAQALDQRMAEGEREIRSRLRVTYGPKDAEELLDRTKRFVRSHPKLAAILREDGLGSRPDIVEEIVAHVFSTGWR